MLTTLFSDWLQEREEPANNERALKRANGDNDQGVGTNGYQSRNERRAAGRAATKQINELQRQLDQKGGNDKGKGRGQQANGKASPTTPPTWKTDGKQNGGRGADGKKPDNRALCVWFQTPFKGDY